MPPTIISPVWASRWMSQHRVLFGEPLEGGQDLVFFALALRRDGEAHERRRERDGRQADDVALGTERVARDDVLELGDGADVAGDEAVDRLGVLAHRLEELTDALLVSVARDDHLGVARERALEHAKDVDVAAERVGERLEDEGGERLGRIADELLLGAIGAGHPDRSDVGRRRRQREQVEQAVDADAVRSRAAGDREDLRGRDGGAEGGAELVGRDLLFHQVLLGEVVVGARHGVDELVAGGCDRVGHVGRDVGGLRLAALIGVGLHAEQVDHAAELVLAADRHLRGNDLRSEGLLQRLDRSVEVGALAVEHVAEEHTGEGALAGPSPQALGLHLDAEHGVDHHHGGLDDVQR